MEYKTFDLYRFVGSNIKKYRKEKGYTQQQIADVLQVSLSTVSHYEQGVNRIPLHRLIKIAEYYDITIDSILDRENSNKQSDNHCYIDNIDEFYTTVSNLSIEKQIALIELVNNMK